MPSLAVHGLGWRSSRCATVRWQPFGRRLVLNVARMILHAGECTEARHLTVISGVDEEKLGRLHRPARRAPNPPLFRRVRAEPGNLVPLLVRAAAISAFYMNGRRPPIDAPLSAWASDTPLGWRCALPWSTDPPPRGPLVSMTTPMHADCVPLLRPHLSTLCAIWDRYADEYGCSGVASPTLMLMPGSYHPEREATTFTLEVLLPPDPSVRRAWRAAASRMATHLSMSGLQTTASFR